MKNKQWLRIPLFLVGLVLCVDGIILFTLKKINFGSILPFLIGSVFCGYGLYHRQITQYLGGKPKLNKLWKAGWIMFSIWCVSLLFFFIYIHQQSTKRHEIQSADVIIVLGSGIVNNRPSQALAERLDTASEIFATTDQAMIIVTGGLGFNQTLTEAEVMATYLQEKHQIPSQRIALEDKSTSTELNLKNSQPILQQYGLNNHSAIVIVTNDFHTLRAGAIARKLGYDNVTTAGATTPLGIRYNAWLREYFAYISGWLLNEY